MNTTSKFDRKTVFVIYVLSAAVWLPLASLAQGLPNSAGSMPGMQMMVHGTTHHQSISGSPDLPYCLQSKGSLPGKGNGDYESTAGFGETDPAGQGALDEPNLNGSNGTPTQRTLIGFAESDPASHTPVNGLDDPVGSTQGRMMQPKIGFAETDPVKSPNWPGADMQNRYLAHCPCEHGERMIHGANGSRCMMCEELHQTHC